MRTSLSFSGAEYLQAQQHQKRDQIKQTKLLLTRNFRFFAHLHRSTLGLSKVSYRIFPTIKKKMEKSLSLSKSLPNLSSSPSGWNFHVSSSVLLPWSARRCPPPGVCGSPCRCRTRWAWRAEARSSQGCVAFHPHRVACWACWGPAAHSQISLYRTALRCDVPSLWI